MAGSNQIITLAGVGIVGYLAYRWYYGPGGYADQATCTASGATDATLQAMAGNINDAAKSKNMTAANYLASVGAGVNATQLACAYVAVAKFPTATAGGGAAIQTPAGPAMPPGPSSPSTPTTPTAPTFNSLDAIYARVQAAAGSTSQTPDQFNFYLNQQLPSGKTAPDPTAVFTQSGFDRTQSMTIANWWGAVAPWLQSNYGLSGLGMFGGLGALARRARGRR